MCYNEAEGTDSYRIEWEGEYDNVKYVKMEEYEELEEKLNDAAEYFSGVLEALYSDEPLDYRLLESNLENCGHNLDVEIPESILNVERSITSRDLDRMLKEDIDTNKEEWIKFLKKGIRS